jgi:hypothetical protein
MTRHGQARALEPQFQAAGGAAASQDLGGDPTVSHQTDVERAMQTEATDGKRPTADELIAASDARRT